MAKFDTRIQRHRNFKTPEFKDTRTTRYQNSKTSKSKDIRIPKYQNPKISESQGTKIPSHNNHKPPDSPSTKTTKKAPFPQDASRQLSITTASIWKRSFFFLSNYFAFGPASLISLGMLGYFLAKFSANIVASFAA